MMDLTYVWRVFLDDQSVINQFVEPGVDIGFQNLPLERVRVIELLSTRGQQPLAVAVPAGADPVYFRRSAMRLNLGTGEQTQDPFRYCIGWKLPASEAYLVVFEDGSVRLSDDCGVGSF